MIKLTGVAAVSAVVYTLVKKYSPEYSVLLELAAVLIVLWIAFPYICDITDFFNDYMSNTGINADYVKMVFKSMGVAVVARFASDICRDSGETALASKVEFAGKAIIIAFSLPMFKALIELADKVINRS